MSYAVFWNLDVEQNANSISLVASSPSYRHSQDNLVALDSPRSLKIPAASNLVKKMFLAYIFIILPAQLIAVAKLVLSKHNQQVLSVNMQMSFNI